MEIHLVTSTDSPEFTYLCRTLTRSSIIALDAEWKPLRSQHSFSFPTVSLLQVACQVHRVSPDSDDISANSDGSVKSAVFLLDLASVSLPSIWELLRDVLVSPDVLKLGFRFKQDLIYLSSTFSAQGCDGGLDKIRPYLDITSIYNHLQHKRYGRKASKDVKSLAAICRELLGLSLSKELQCSDWSHRPLTEEQKFYAATDAYCLLQIFDVFKAQLVEEGFSLKGIIDADSSNMMLGLKEILEKSIADPRIFSIKLFEASNVVRATASSLSCDVLCNRVIAKVSPARNTMPMDEFLLKIVRMYGEQILLRDTDLMPKKSKRKGRKRTSAISVNKENHLDCSGDWQGPPPWDVSCGGDGCPKFLCDVMVEGLAKHLRCVGIDAAISLSRKPEPRKLLDQALKENRVLLTRDAKLLRHQYVVKNQIYRVKSLLKNEQLLEVIETFQLNISEDKLMSRCTKCNGRFIQKPLSMEEAIEAAKGFQKIPSCLFDKNLEFWQCMECSQLYWEGTQYHNAVQKFIDVCKLNEE